MTEIEIEMMQQNLIDATKQLANADKEVISWRESYESAMLKLAALQAHADKMAEAIKNFVSRWAPDEDDECDEEYKKGYESLYLSRIAYEQFKNT